MPRLPYRAELAWRSYRRIHSRRGDGFEIPQPLTYAELEAFKAATLTWVSAWDAELIMRIDTAARAAWVADAAEARQAAQDGSSGQGRMISMKDGKGIAGLLRRTAKRVNSRKKPD